MPIYNCDKCNKIFNKKSAYKSHLKRVNPCVKDTNIMNDCEYCNKSYSTKYKLNAHIKKCKEKPIKDNTLSQIDELKKMFEEQQKQIEEQKKKIEELSHITESNQNITLNENSHNTTNNVINIYSTGKEDLSHLSQEDILKLCTSGTYYPIEAAKILHCNKDYPQYQNVYISNLRSNTGKVKINNEWVTKSQDDILNTVMHVDKQHISNLIKDIKVDSKYKVKLESTKDEIDTNECKEHHKHRIKQKFYDASPMVKENNKKAKGTPL